MVKLPALFWVGNFSNSNYQVEPRLFPMLADWRREYTMEDILMQLKKEMFSPQNRKLAQPPEGVSVRLLSPGNLLFSLCINLVPALQQFFWFFLFYEDSFFV